jgi:hypothetical protein
MPGITDLLQQLGIFATLTMVAALAPFGLAVSYALRPTERKLALMRPVSLATIFAALAAGTSGIAIVLQGVAATPPDQIAAPRVYMGLAEVITPAFVCFGFLAATWLLVAAGMLRRSTP